jgi:hypothetical protein
MKKLVLVLSVVLGFAVMQPVQAQDQKVLAIIDTAVDSNRVPQVIYEACFTSNSVSVSCPNKTSFMEGKGAASSPVWPASIQSSTYHGHNVVMSALAVDPSLKIVFVRIADITASGNSNNQPNSIVNAIKWVSENAAKHSIDAVSISQSGISANNISACTTNTVVIKAVESLNQQNVPVFAATGNDRSQTLVGFPACVAGVIGVGALASTESEPIKKLPNTFTLFQAITNRGPGLDVVAQGSIEVIRYNGFLTEVSGTSIASPIAASVYVKNSNKATFSSFSSGLTKILGYPYISR